MKCIYAIATCFLMLLPCCVYAQVTINDPMPTQILTCGGSVVSSIGGRLEGDPNMSSGYSVEFKNGGTTVDYETPRAVRTSKVGDHVMICLIYIPRNCPHGDNRGRVYTVTNLRTLKSWNGSNSEHTCGGA